jgi:hypothetical protein
VKRSRHQNFRHSTFKDHHTNEPISRSTTNTRFVHAAPLTPPLKHSFNDTPILPTQRLRAAHQQRPQLLHAPPVLGDLPCHDGAARCRRRDESTRDRDPADYLVGGEAAGHLPELDGAHARPAGCLGQHAREVPLVHLAPHEVVLLAVRAAVGAPSGAEVDGLDDGADGGGGVVEQREALVEAVALERSAGAVALAPVLGAAAAGGGHEAIQRGLVVQRRLGEGGQLVCGERQRGARDVDVGAAVRGGVGDVDGLQGGENGLYVGGPVPCDGIDWGDELDAPWYW